LGGDELNPLRWATTGRSLVVDVVGLEEQVAVVGEVDEGTDLHCVALLGVGERAEDDGLELGCGGEEKPALDDAAGDFDQDAWLGQVAECASHVLVRRERALESLWKWVALRRGGATCSSTGRARGWLSRRRGAETSRYFLTVLRLTPISRATDRRERPSIRTLCRITCT
jgi:hypothetical protein